jgi:hypothetical protein
MMKHSFALLVASVATSLLAGCELYFGDGHDGDGGEWNYCGSDGYYTCEGDNCSWQGPNCPAGTGSGTTQPGGGSGFDCQANTDCAAGCYCANGTCEEAGFCTQDSDCGMGYVCNEDRSSCEPNTAPTCYCTSDQEAAAQGFDYCNEWTGECKTGTDPAGTCAGEATCNIVPPTCQAGDVPLLGSDGCWTGECQAASQCADAPACSHIKDAATCSGQTGCHQVVNGIDCHITGTTTACQDGDANCTCSSYVFASCAATP